MKNNSPSPATQRLLYRILLAGGLMMFALGVTMTLPAVKSLSWPSTNGVIIGHRIEQVYSFKTSRPAVVVRYSYAVDGARYRSEKFSQGSQALTAPASNSQAALATYRTDPAFRNYQQGSKVMVYYDPADPGNAVLKRGVGLVEIGLLLLGVFLLGTAFYERRRLNTSATAKNAPSTP